MSTFLFLYKGHVPPTPEIGEAWMGWFDTVGDSMVDSGHPMTRGVEVTPHGVADLPLDAEAFTGYSIIEADSHEAAVKLAGTNPMVTSVVVHELTPM